MAEFKVSTAFLHQFVMVSNTDHISGKTGIGSAVTVYLGKNGNAGVLAANSSAVTEIDSTHMPGVYSIQFTAGDLNVTGSLTFAATASGADPTNETHQVRTQLFTDLLLDSSGRVKILNNLQQNTALNGFSFPMTSATTGLRQTGYMVTAQRTLGSGGFASCTNAPAEIGTTGIYAINLAAGDVNAATLGLLFTAPGANDLYIPITPTP